MLPKFPSGPNKSFSQNSQFAQNTFINLSQRNFPDISINIHLHYNRDSIYTNFFTAIAIVKHTTWMPIHPAKATEPRLKGCLRVFGNAFLLGQFSVTSFAFSYWSRLLTRRGFPFLFVLTGIVLVSPNFLKVTTPLQVFASST